MPDRSACHRQRARTARAGRRVGPTRRHCRQCVYTCSSAELTAQDYGPSETTVGVISARFDDADALATMPAIVPIGTPNGASVVRLVRPDSLELVPLGCIGEIVVGGPQVAQGYVDARLDEGRFVAHDEWGRLYRTGDLARWISVGDEVALECLGRADSQIKINGLRIEIGEIERHLNGADERVASAVVEKVEVNASPSIVAFVELRSAEKADDVTIVDDAPDFDAVVEVLSGRLRAALPTYMMPSRWLAVSRMPTMPSGKTDRKTLRQLGAGSASQRQSSSTTPSVPTDEHELAVRSVWAAVLRMDESAIGRDSAFTRLGGDSIAFIRVVAQLRRRGFSHISHASLLDCVTLADVAAVLKRSGAEPNGRDDEEYAPFSLVSTNVRKEVDPESELEDVLPTCPSQDALLAPSFETSLFYAQAVYAVNPAFDRSTVAGAIEQLIARTPTLRTAFAWSERAQRVFQLVHRPRSAALEHVKCEVHEVAADHLEVDIDVRRSDQHVAEIAGLLSR